MNKSDWDQDAKKIAKHSVKHLSREHEKWNELGVTNEHHLEDKIKDVRNHKDTESFWSLSEDKIYHLKKDEKIIMIEDPNAPNKGTIFREKAEDKAESYVQGKLKKENRSRGKSRLKIPTTELKRGGRQALPLYDQLSKEEQFFLNKKKVLFDPSEEKGNQKKTDPEKSLVDNRSSFYPGFKKSDKNHHLSKGVETSLNQETLENPSDNRSLLYPGYQEYMSGKSDYSVDREGGKEKGQDSGIDAGEGEKADGGVDID